MSFKATVWAWQQNLRPTHKLLLLKLSDRANNNNFCFPSIKSLAMDTGLDRKTIFSALKILKDKKIIVVEKGFKGRANIYHLKISSSKNGTITIPKTELNTVPKTAHQSIRESKSKSYIDNEIEKLILER